MECRHPPISLFFVYTYFIKFRSLRKRKITTKKTQKLIMYLGLKKFMFVLCVIKIQ